MKHLSIILFLFYSLAVTAQEDGKAWLERMNRTYANASSVQMSFVVDYYGSTKQTTPTTSAKGQVRYSGSNYYSDAMGQIVIVNKKYMLLIDKAQHTITCLPGTGKQKADKSTTTGQPDSAWLSANKILLLNTDGPFRRLEISGNDPVYEKTEITINAQTYALEQVVFFYQKQEDGSKPKLVVRYTDVRLNSGLTEADFSEKQYIQKKNGTLIAAPAWSNYKIIDLMEGKPE